MFCRFVWALFVHLGFSGPWFARFSVGPQAQVCVFSLVPSRAGATLSIQHKVQALPESGQVEEGQLVEELLEVVFFGSICSAQNEIALLLFATCRLLFAKGANVPSCLSDPLLQRAGFSTSPLRISVWAFRVPWSLFFVDVRCSNGASSFRRYSYWTLTQHHISVRETFLCPFSLGCGLDHWRLLFLYVGVDVPWFSVCGGDLRVL